MLQNDSQTLTRLRWQGLLVTALYGIAVVIFYTYLRQEWQSSNAQWWLGLAIIATMVQMCIFWWGLRYNHRPDEPVLFPRLGYANAMTLTRGLLTCLLAGFLFSPELTGRLAWIPALLYMTERLLDYFDGYVARITGRETKLGTILDMEFDGLGILIAAGLAIQYGKLPVWYLVLGLARQLFVLGMWLRQVWHKPVHDLPPSDHRRLIAGFQTSFVSVALWPILGAQITLLLGTLFALPLIFSFGRDWLAVSGVIDAQSAGYQRLRQRAKTIIEGWLPLIMRVLCGLLAFFLLWQMSGTDKSPFLWLLWIVGALAMLLGVLGRVAALVLVSLACAESGAVGLPLANQLLLIGTIFILHLGSGKLALWKPEDPILHRKMGEKGS